MESGQIRVVGAPKTDRDTFETLKLLAEGLKDALERIKKLESGGD